MTTGSISGADGTAHLQGRAHYRTTGHGEVVVVPTRCLSGLDTLTNVGYRIYETSHTLHVSCQACDQTLTTNGQQAASAEFDDAPYAKLLKSLARPS